MVSVPWQKLRSVVDVAAGLAVVIIAGAILWKFFGPMQPVTIVEKPKPPDAPIPEIPVNLDNVYFRGSPNAPAVIVEYADFECPACASFAKGTMRGLTTSLIDSGKVRFGFKHFPLPRHAQAKPAAVAAECAGREGKFWDFYTVVFSRPGKLDAGVLAGAATTLGIDRAVWSECQALPHPIVDGHLAEAKALKLRGTPAFLIGRPAGPGQLKVATVIVGAKPLQDFEKAIQQMLQR